jgi:hypothetical protein
VSTLTKDEETPNSVVGSIRAEDFVATVPGATSTRIFLAVLCFAVGCTPPGVIV